MVSSFARSLRALRTWDGNRFSGASGSGAVRPAAPAVLGIPPPRPHHQPPPPVGASVLQLQKQPAVGIRPVGQLGEAPGGYAAQFGHPVPPADQPGPDPTPTPTTRTSSARPAGTIRCRRRINHGGISACATPAGLTAFFARCATSSRRGLLPFDSLRTIAFFLMGFCCFCY
uniref:Uncharacterized protein n=1 Tax=Setaria italica TaxID=4555 RepID=K4AFW5_SETIT